MLSVLVVTSCSPGESSDQPSTAIAGVPAPTVAVSSNPRWPSSIAGRKILDQYGDVYLMRSFSSWSMAMNLTDSEITTALAGVAGRGFNAVTVWAGGGYDIGDGWNRYTTAQHGKWWNGTPWASGLGPGWAAMDRVVKEARRLGLTVNFSFCGGNGTTGARPDWEEATNAQMHNIGVAIAKRYPVRDYPNIVWHVMFDDAISGTTAARINALFDGINDTEGARARPVRWAETTNGVSTHDALISGAAIAAFRPSMNGFYDNWFNSSVAQNATELVEASWRESGATTRPTGDQEPGYDASPHIDVGNRGQQLRERSYAVFLEGGSYINYSHEDWWRFGAQGWVDSTEDLAWNRVPAHGHTVQQQYVWKLVDAYVADPTWVPETRSFLTTGTGRGDTKAAAGRSASAAVAYFPSSRSVVVNTTVIAGTKRVRLRWYNPVTGRYRAISTSEAQRTNRSVSYPPAHSDGTRDWVLVVDRARSATVSTAPRSLTARSRDRAVKLSWLAPRSNGGAAISDYRVQRSANGGRTWRRVRDGVSTDRTVRVGGLTNGHRYRFRVAALNRVGRGPWSDTASAVPATVPTRPRRLDATRAFRAVTLTWRAPWSSGGAAITDYRVQRSANGGRTWTRVRDGVNTRRAVTVSGLVSGKQYSFRVAAKNRVGRGAWSAIVRARPR